MEQVIATTANLIAIIFAPIGCWLAYKSFPINRLAELKKEMNSAIRLAIFLSVTVSLAISFLLETISPDPLTRTAVAEMCLYATSIAIWTFLHAFLFILKSLLAHSRIINEHLNITQLTAEHVIRAER